MLVCIAESMNGAQKRLGSKFISETAGYKTSTLVRRQKLQLMLDLHGKVNIDYDWEREEILELKVSSERDVYINLMPNLKIIRGA